MFNRIIFKVHMHVSAARYFENGEEKTTSCFTELYFKQMK